MVAIISLFFSPVLQHCIDAGFCFGDVFLDQVCRNVNYNPVKADNVHDCGITLEKFCFVAVIQAPVHLDNQLLIRDCEIYMILSNFVLRVNSVAEPTKTQFLRVNSPSSVK